MGTGTGYVRVGPKAEGVRGTYRFIRGRDLQTGKRHEGRWSDGKHAAFRFGVIAWFAVEILLWVAHWVNGWPGWFPVWWFHLTLALLFIGALHWMCVRVHNWAAVYFHAEPLHRALFDLVGWPENEPPSHWIHLPVGFKHRDGAVLRIDLKHKNAQWLPEERERFVAICARKLKLEFDPDDAAWNMDGRKPHVLLRRPMPPPAVAWFVDYVERIENSRKRGEIVWGVGANDKLVKDDITGETPMGAVVALPMRGKSQTLADAGCQFAHDAAVLACLDPKAGSLRCFKDIPNAAYAGNAEQADELIHRLYAEYQRRTQLLGDRPHGTKAPVFIPILIEIEEADGLIEQLRILHFNRTGSRSNVPAIAELLMLRNMGRELAMYQLMVTQSGDAKAAGSGGGRSAFAFFLGSCDRASWRKITGAGELHKPISPHKGRWHRFRNGVLTEVQVFGFHDPPPGTEAEKMQEARDYALSGRVTPIPDYLLPGGPVPDWMETLIGTSAVSLTGPRIGAGMPMAHGAPVARDGVPVAHARHLSVVPDEWPESLTAQIVLGRYNEPASEPVEVWITLSEAVEEDTLPLNLNAARAASKRKGFPPEKPGERRVQEFGAPAKLYRRSDLEAYAVGKRWTLDGAERA